jgi:hypothetical protein
MEMVNDVIFAFFSFSFYVSEVCEDKGQYAMGGANKAKQGLAVTFYGKGDKHPCH